MNNKAESKKDRNSRSLTEGIIRIFIFCWVIPYLILSLTLLFWNNNKNQKQATETIESSIDNAATICITSINNAIAESKRASYDGVIKQSYINFQKDKDQDVLYHDLTSYLNRTYKYSSTIMNTIIMFKDEELKSDYYTVSNFAGATYTNVDEFKKDAKFIVEQMSESLGTRTEIFFIKGHLYIVRNIVSGNYEPFATMVMEVNASKLFKSMDSIVWMKGNIYYMENQEIFTSLGLDRSQITKIENYATKNVLDIEEPLDDESVSKYDSSSNMAYSIISVNKQKFSFVSMIDSSKITTEYSAFWILGLFMLFMLIPLAVTTFYYLFSNIHRPMGMLMDASEKIRSGEYGVRIEGFDKNNEFSTMIDTFNDMSQSLEDSFNRIYAEEVAVRDANMKALQSQINPHFLNNTLEIINWKARMGGNDDVSDMITNLSIMMNAALDRNNEPFISIAEEMSYVNAYLFIIDQRFGKKFKSQIEVDDDLLETKIPRLIIQPIVENAVEHGGDLSGNREVRLSITSDKKRIYICVENNGMMTEEDKEKVRLLLESNEHPFDKKSIGIRNVNLRIKMIYGKDSGLSIEDDGKGTTYSRIVIDKEVPKKNAEQENTTANNPVQEQ